MLLYSCSMAGFRMGGSSMKQNVWNCAGKWTISSFSPSFCLLPSFFLPSLTPMFIYRGFKRFRQESRIRSMKKSVYIMTIKQNQGWYGEIFFNRYKLASLVHKHSLNLKLSDSCWQMNIKEYLIHYFITYVPPEGIYEWEQKQLIKCLDELASGRDLFTGLVYYIIRLQIWRAWFPVFNILSFQHKAKSIEVYHSQKLKRAPFRENMCITFLSNICSINFYIVFKIFSFGNSIMKFKTQICNEI